jgi:hypothetical protein
VLISSKRAGRFRDRMPVRRDIPTHVRGYICPACDLVLADGVAYEICPACEARVDWVSLEAPVWACPGCDAVVNEARTDAPFCEPCKRRLVLVHDPTSAPRARVSWSLRNIRAAVFAPTGLATIYVVSLVPGMSLALDSRLKGVLVALAAPFLLLPVLLALFVMGVAGASFRGVLAVLKEGNTRIVHGLEHATIKLLEQRGVPVLGGQTWGDSFEAYFDADRPWEHKEKSIRRALREAVERLCAGERKLAYDRRCGTSFLVGALVLALLGSVAGAVGFLVTLEPRQLLILFGALALLPLLAARPLGLLAQRLFTVSVRFRHARLVRVIRKPNHRRTLRYEVVVEVERSG